MRIIKRGNFGIPLSKPKATAPPPPPPPPPEKEANPYLRDDEEGFHPVCKSILTGLRKYDEREAAKFAYPAWSWWAAGIVFVICSILIFTGLLK